MGAPRISSILAAVAVLLAAAAHSAAQSYSPPDIALPRLAPSASLEAFAGAQEVFSPDAFLEAAVDLSAIDPVSGLPGPGAEDALARLRAFVAVESASLSAIQDPRERADTALARLHEGLLTRYVERSTGLDSLAETGEYNCVSSAIAYAALAKASGLGIIGVETTDHAFCSVLVGDARIDVETTNPYGFDPGTKKELFDASFGKATGFAYVPPGNYRLRKDLGEREFLSLIIRNRISGLESLRRNGEALSLAADLYAFFPSESSRVLLGERASNSAARLLDAGKSEEALVLLDAIGDSYGSLPKTEAAHAAAVRNALASFGTLKEYDRGLAFIDYARAKYGENPAYGEFERMRANNLSVSFMKSGEFETAIAFLDAEAAAGRFPPEDAAALKENAAIAWALSSMKGGDFGSTLGLCARLYSGGSLSKPRLSELLASFCGQEANRIAKLDPIRGWFDAAAAFNAGLALLPGDPSLSRGLVRVLDNFETAVLNRSASLSNAGKTPEAVSALEEGLKLLPEGVRMKARLDALRKARNGG